MLEYDRIDFPKELILIKQTHQKSLISAIIGTFYTEISLVLLFEPYLLNGCHDSMQKVMNFNDVAIVSVKGSDYRIHF